jgi:RNA polymerase sigma factor (sigma-70 family)
VPEMERSRASAASMRSVLDIDRSGEPTQVTATDALYRQHIGRARRLAFLLAGSEKDSDDIAHDAFLRCAGRFGLVREPERFGAYLNRAVTRAVLDHRRSTARRLRREHRVAGGLPDRQAAEASHHLADRVDVMAALEKLPDKQRAAVVLKYWLGYTETEIAKVLRCPVGTVKSRLARALASLRGALDA